jgi:hypothetical protein
MDGGCVLTCARAVRWSAIVGLAECSPTAGASGALGRNARSIELFEAAEHAAEEAPRHGYQIGEASKKRNSRTRRSCWQSHLDNALWAHRIRRTGDLTTKVPAGS